MMKILLVFTGLALGTPFSQAATKVAVLQFGRNNVVRRTSAKSTETTVEGVASFWSALHSPSRKPQHAGMTVVPDLFSKADSSVVVGISGNGVDLESLPTVSRLVSQEGNNVVGQMEVYGSRCDELMSHVKDVDASDLSSMAGSVLKQAKVSGISGVKGEVTGENAEELDTALQSMMEELERLAFSSNKSIVIHLVIEEEEASARRRVLKALSRRLDEEEEEEENNENENNANGNANGYDGYYGYGYYNAYGEWVTPYKTMFQIQYFNVVFWSAIGLGIVLFYCIYLMINMPMHPDTLLFGESAKLVGDE